MLDNLLNLLLVEYSIYLTWQSLQMLRPIHNKRVYVRLRPSTRVNVVRPSTRVYANMEHMLKGLRVHTKRVYVRRLRPSTDVDARLRPSTPC